MSNFLDDNVQVDAPKMVRLEWRSEKQSFCFQKLKEGTEKEYETVLVNNIEFTPVDLAFRIGGWNDKEESYLYSNTVQNLKEHNLTVRYAKNKSEVASGIYGQIKDTVAAKGGKYQNVLYAVLTGANGKTFEDNPRFCEIIISGSSSTGLSNANINIFSLVGQYALIQNGFTEEKKGATKYFAPKFTLVKIDKTKASVHVINFAKEIGSYLKSYIANTQKKIVNEPQAPVENPYQHTPKFTEDRPAYTPQGTQTTKLTLNDGDDSFPLVEPSANFANSNNKPDDLPF